jgi:hypothetical protein
MQWSDITFAPSARLLRQFAGLWLLFFTAVALWQGYGRGNETAMLVIAAVTLPVGVAGLIKPQTIRWVFVAWTVLAFPIGWTVSRLVIACLFYGLFTPLALVFRLLGRDALRLRPQPTKDTYWVVKPAATTPRSYLRQF